VGITHPPGPELHQQSPLVRAMGAVGLPSTTSCWFTVELRVGGQPPGPTARTVVTPLGRSPCPPVFTRRSPGLPWVLAGPSSSVVVLQLGDVVSTVDLSLRTCLHWGHSEVVVVRSLGEVGSKDQVEDPGSSWSSSPGFFHVKGVDGPPPPAYRHLHARVDLLGHQEEEVPQER
jgi:hypothetical protein